jgi:hypothetical protein
MKSLVLILLFAGVLAITIGYVNQVKSCPPPTIEYRYIPRTFAQEQDDPVKISELFNSMFTEPNPWIRNFDTPGSSNTEINRYFISQA